MPYGRSRPWDTDDNLVSGPKGERLDGSLKPILVAVPGGETEKYLIERMKQERDRMFEDGPVNDSCVRFDKEVQFNQQPKEENMAPFPSQQFQDRAQQVRDPGQAVQVQPRPYPDMSNAKTSRAQPSVPEIDELRSVMAYLHGEINCKSSGPTRMFYECMFGVLEAVVQSLTGDKPTYSSYSHKAVHATLVYLQGYPNMSHSDAFIGNLFATAEQGVAWYLEAMPPQPEF